MFDLTFYFHSEAGSFHETDFFASHAILSYDSIDHEGPSLEKTGQKYRQTHTERMAVNGQPPLLESEKNTAFQLFENMQHSCWREHIL